MQNIYIYILRSSNMAIYLYHYYDQEIGPFKNLSALSDDEAKQILLDMRETKPYSQPAQRDVLYMMRRRQYEKIAYDKFVEIGGKPQRTYPQYMVVEYCKWMSEWYQNSAFVKIPIEKFNKDTISFTYGDMPLNFSPLEESDNKPYRGKVYNYEQILKVIEEYGLPQEWNPNGELGPERYIEVQVWSDDAIAEYLK